MSSRRALFFSMLDRHSALVISLASSVVIARLLTPEEIGVFSVVMVLLSFMQTVRDFGVGQYIVREPLLDATKLRAAWAVQLCLGCGMAVVIAVSSPWVAAFYKRAEITGIMLVTALGFLVTPFGSITHAWLSRHLDFGSIAKIRLASNVAGAVVSVGLAAQGCGPISLAWGGLASTATTALVSMRYRARELPWLPRFTGLRHIASFGGLVSAISFSNTFYRGAAELVLGRVSSMSDVGYYSRGLGLVYLFERLVLDAVNAVALPYFAQQFRAGQPMGDAYIKVTALVTGVGWPFLAFVACHSYAIIELLFGAQWQGAGDITRWICLATALQMPVFYCQQPLIAAGRTRRVALIAASVGVMHFCGVLIGAQFGLRATGVAVCVTAALSSLMWLMPSRGWIEFRWLDLGRQLTGSAFVALVTFAAALAPGGLPIKAAQAGLPLLIASGVSAAAAFLGAVALTDHPVWRELRRLHHGRRAMRRKRAS